MTTAWSHLPNASHIDRIIADTQANPDKWRAVARTTATDISDDAWDAAWDAAWDTRGAARDDAATAACDAAWDTRGGARSAINALVAYDDCAHLLDNDPEHVRLMALLGSDAAILLYPACVALNKQRELV